jgi:hypothetical protein
MKHWLSFPGTVYCSAAHKPQLLDAVESTIPDWVARRKSWLPVDVAAQVMPLAAQPLAEKDCPPHARM